MLKMGSLLDQNDLEKYLNLNQVINGYSINYLSLQQFITVSHFHRHYHIIIITINFHRYTIITIFHHHNYRKILFIVSNFPPLTSYFSSHLSLSTWSSPLHINN